MHEYFGILISFVHQTKRFLPIEPKVSILMKRLKILQFALKHSYVLCYPLHSSFFTPNALQSCQLSLDFEKANFMSVNDISHIILHFAFSIALLVIKKKKKRRRATCNFSDLWHESQTGSNLSFNATQINRYIITNYSLPLIKLSCQISLNF